MPYTTEELKDVPFYQNFVTKLRSKYLQSLKNSANHAKKIGMEVHAGHGLTYKSAQRVSRIKNISEFNIGHFIISESIFFGFKNTIKKFKNIINK